MNKKELFVAGLVVALAVLAALFTYGWLSHRSSGPGAGLYAGAAGNLLIEQYDPYVQQNGGMNTALPAIFSGGTTLSGTNSISGATTFTSTAKIGSSGTALSNAVIATCAAIANNSITASTTGYAYCTGVTGVTSSDITLAQFSTSTLGFTNADNWYITSARASSTAGTIDFEVFNGTGKTQAPSAASKTGSTTAIFVAH